MSNAEFTIVEPFDIDNGELDGISPQNIFCMGYEFCQVRDMLVSGETISKPVHSDNASRIKRMCIRQRRLVKIDTMRDGWSWMEVADTAGRFRDDAPAAGELG
jgi:hypothetical protein